MLAGNPRRDLITAANQHVTRDWWRLRRAQFLCIASHEEASRGDPGQVRRRKELLAKLTFVEPTPETERLAQAFRATKALPAKAETDTAHLAIATAASADYLMMWNCRHLANAQIMRRLEWEALNHGWPLPKVCTPVELSPYEDETDA